MAKLIVQRTSEWNNRMRNIGIYLDGEKIGVIGNGQTKEFEVAPGEHNLETKIDWCGSEILTFELSDTETKEIEVSGFKHGNWMMPIAVVISVIYLGFGEQLKVDTGIFLMLILPFGLYLAYHLTFGKNKYLRLKEK